MEILQGFRDILFEKYVLFAISNLTKSIQTFKMKVEFQGKGTEMVIQEKNTGIVEL